VTAVEFHTGVDDPLDFACRLLRKAYQSGSRVQVTAPEPLLIVLDRALWTQREREFVPHVRVAGASAAMLRRTPLWLSDHAPEVIGAHAPAVLVNLGAAIGDMAGRYQRVIEIVSLDPDDAQAGRERWRQYKALGLDVVHKTPA